MQNYLFIIFILWFISLLIIILHNNYVIILYIKKKKRQFTYKQKLKTLNTVGIKNSNNCIL